MSCLVRTSVPDTGLLHRRHPHRLADRAVTRPPFKRARVLEDFDVSQERAIAISRHERSLIIQAREDSLKNLLRIIETWSHDRKLQEFFDEIAARSVNMNGEDRSQLLAKIHEAKNLLACVDSVDALMSWVTSPPKPAE